MTALLNNCGEPDLLEFIEPWRCYNCDELMYNKDQDGYPSPGAPIGLAIHVEEKPMRVCLLCVEMYIAVLKSTYMKDQHIQWQEENKHKEKLRFGGKYLDR
jgi:hypothetical protein